MAGCNHVRQYQATKERLQYYDKVFDNGRTGSDHVRQYQEQEQRGYKVTWREFEKCMHGVEGYCRQCLASVSPDPEYWHAKMASAPIYKGKEKPVKNAEQDSQEVLDYIALRKVILRSISRFCHKERYFYSETLVEDCYQESLLKAWQNKKQIAKYCKENSIPEKAIIAKMAREGYLRLLCKEKPTLERVIDFDVDGFADTPFYKNNLDVIPLENSLDFALTVKHYKLKAIDKRIIAGLLAGYNFNEVSEQNKLHRNSLSYRLRVKIIPCLDVNTYKQAQERYKRAQ